MLWIVITCARHFFFFCQVHSSLLLGLWSVYTVCLQHKSKNEYTSEKWIICEDMKQFIIVITTNSNMSNMTLWSEWERTAAMGCVWHGYVSPMVQGSRQVPPPPPQRIAVSDVEQNNHSYRVHMSGNVYFWKSEEPRWLFLNHHMVKFSASISIHVLYMRV